MNSLIGLVVLVLDIVALIDCWKSDKEQNNKILWTILIILVPVVGMILYFLLGKKK